MRRRGEKRAGLELRGNKRRGEEVTGQTSG